MHASKINLRREFSEIPKSLSATVWLLAFIADERRGKICNMIFWLISKSKNCISGVGAIKGRDLWVGRSQDTRDMKYPQNWAKRVRKKLDERKLFIIFFFIISLEFNKESVFRNNRFTRISPTLNLLILKIYSIHSFGSHHSLEGVQKLGKEGPMKLLRFISRQIDATWNMPLCGI